MEHTDYIKTIKAIGADLCHGLDWGALSDQSACVADSVCAHLANGNFFLALIAAQKVPFIYDWLCETYEAAI